MREANGSWRALLESLNIGERAGSATLAELAAILENQTGETSQTLMLTKDQREH